MIPKFRAWHTPFKGKKFGQEMKYGRSGTLLSFAEMSPDDYILMQSTGMKDKNGVEIFEGDVLLYTSKSINYGDAYWESYVQVYRMNSGAYRIKGEHIYDTELMGVRKNLEVVGNIYQSEELLSVDRFMTTDGIVRDGE